MVTTQPTTSDSIPVPLGVKVARWAGHFLGLLLIGLGIGKFLQSPEGLFPIVQAIYFILYGILINLPFHRIPEKSWKWSIGLLAVTSAAFVFVMIFSVMFDYMAAAEMGERLGVPGFEGMLIFFALMQVPAVIFERRPDLLD